MTSPYNRSKNGAKIIKEIRTPTIPIIHRNILKEIKSRSISISPFSSYSFLINDDFRFFLTIIISSSSAK